MLAAGWAEGSGVSLACATVDHGLRPEAAAEAQAVAGLCRSLSIPHTTLRWTPDGGPVSQASARSARHRLLADWATEQRLPAIAMGHTADDRIETFLIRARAGSGWYGLAGPMPSAPSPVAGVRLLRPLLGARRADLRTWLLQRATGWSEDPTNLNPRYERVRMRFLAAALPETARQSILASMNRLAALRASVMAQAAAILPFAQLQDGRARLAAEPYRALGVEARMRLLDSLVSASAPGHAPPARPSLERIDAGLIGGAAKGATLAGLMIRLSNGAVEITVAPARRGKPDRRPHGLEATLARAAQTLADPLIETLRTAQLP